MTPEDKYPAPMDYIADRSSKDERTAWNMLRADEAAALQETAQTSPRILKMLKRIMQLLR